MEVSLGQRTGSVPDRFHAARDGKRLVHSPLLSSMSGVFRLYGLPPSHYCISAELMLAFKGIPFERVYAPYHDRQELLRLSGQDYVPALFQDGKFVPWYAIPDHLETVRPSPTLYPRGEKGLSRTLEHWGHQVLEERVWKAVVTKVPPVLRSPEERWVFEEMQTRARGPWAVQEARREEFLRDLKEPLSLLEDMLDGREWLLGEPGLADFGVYGGLSPLFTVGDPLPAGFPRTEAWVGRLQSLLPP